MSLAADQLRRAMGTFKFTDGVKHFHYKFVDGMIANGYPPDFAERTFKQLEGFGSYGFPESHAASFALIAYGSSWMKCHHPDVFLAAILNAQPMGFYDRNPGLSRVTSKMSEPSLRFFQRERSKSAIPMVFPGSRMTRLIEMQINDVQLSAPH
jgi:DNA polymerase III alpha subunit